MAGIFIAGATGYMGSRLVGQLVDDGHQVKALSRRAIDLPCDVVHGDALDASTYAENVVGCSSFVHLVGTPHPAPWKENQFRKVDLASLKQSVRAAKLAEISHFVYVSVAHPAPAMRAYVRVRMECEEIIAGSGLSATILRVACDGAPGRDPQGCPRAGDPDAASYSEIGFSVKAAPARCRRNYPR